MCLLRDTAETCACATAALGEQLGVDDYALYDDIGRDYVARMAAGADWVAAWDAALDAAAPGLGLTTGALMKRTNEFGKAHRSAIDACKDS